MNRVDQGYSRIPVLYSVAVLALAVTGICYYLSVSEGRVLAGQNPSDEPQTEAVFAADPASLGAIPDSPATGPGAFGTPRDVTFTVSGLTGTVSTVEVSFTSGGPSHTFRGDLDVRLKAPGGSPEHVIFSRTGATTAGSFGSGADLTGPYVFTDTASGTNWWSVTATPTTPGSYRTTVAGPSTSPAAVTNMNPVFAGGNPNGTWTLSFRDGAAADTGSINAASLTIETSGGPAVPNSQGDFDGDGRTDFSVLREAGSPLEGGTSQVTWWIQEADSGAIISRDWGLSSDFFVPADYNGDGRDDIAVWRPGVQGTFYIILSQSNTIVVQDFGIAGDDPTVVGDYNNDNRDDLAVYRQGVLPGDQSFWYWREVDGGMRKPIPWGLNGDHPAPGDYNGDGSNDFVVQRAEGPNSVFYIRTSTGILSSVTFGLANDIVVPGDYDGDGSTDIAVMTPDGSVWRWNVRQSSNLALLTDTWGLVASDLPAPGDYNGDGTSDYGVWRPDSLATFYTMTPVTRQIRNVQWGLGNDVPVMMSYSY